RKPAFVLPCFWKYSGELMIMASSCSMVGRPPRNGTPRTWSGPLRRGWEGTEPHRCFSVGVLGRSSPSPIVSELTVHCGQRADLNIKTSVDKKILDYCPGIRHDVLAPNPFGAKLRNGEIRMGLIPHASLTRTV